MIRRTHPEGRSSVLVCGGLQFDSMDQGGKGVLSYEQVSQNTVSDHWTTYMNEVDRS